jgi:hypothetical protein
VISLLEQPVVWDSEAIAGCQYAALDGKFLFGRECTVLVLYNARANLPVASKLVSGENKREITAFLLELKQHGFNPIAMTTDGRGTIASCCKGIFPEATTQRCLFHIKLQINAWVRQPPRTSLGWQLHELANCLMAVDSLAKEQVFWEMYDDIKLRNKHEIARLRRNPSSRMESDTAKCFPLLDNAKASMFCFLHDKQIANTTSGLEGFNKQIQRIRGFDHNGLTREHVDQFIKYYILLKKRMGTRKNSTK